MIKKEKRLICAIMILMLICLLFCSAAFGQMSHPYASISGTIFYKDGKTPFVIPTNCVTQVKLLNYNTGYYGGQMSYLDSSAGYNIPDIDPKDNPYFLLVETTDNTTGQVVYNDSICPYRSPEFNVTAGTDMVMNVTTSRRLTN